MGGDRLHATVGVYAVTSELVVGRDMKPGQLASPPQAWQEEQDRERQ